MLEPPADLPAAHSMDAEWFAIDGNGRIAVFQSGERGEVPDAFFEYWPGRPTWEEVLGEMITLSPPGTIPFVADGVWEQPADRYGAGQLFTSRELEGVEFSHHNAVLIELGRAREPTEIEAALPHARPLDCAAPIVYADDWDFMDLYDAWDQLGIVRLLLGPEFGPERFGVYTYECDPSGEPYVQSATPLAPSLRVDVLPTSLRQRFAHARLGSVDFARDLEVWPSVDLPTTDY